MTSNIINFMEDYTMANNVNETVEVKEKKESIFKRIAKSKTLKTVVSVTTTVLTVANTIFLVWTCASSAEAEVNADVLPEYNKMKNMEVNPGE